jgi:hypothetical protein
MADLQFPATHYWLTMKVWMTFFYVAGSPCGTDGPHLFRFDAGKGSWPVNALLAWQVKIFKAMVPVPQSSRHVQISFWTDLGLQIMIGTTDFDDQSDLTYIIWTNNFITPNQEWFKVKKHRS